MDHPAFRDIGARQQKQRLGAWNDLRRTKKRVRHLSARASKKDKASEPGPPGVEPESLEPEPEAQDAGSGAEARGAAEEAALGKAVLGRLALVRQKTGGHVDPLARLLSYF